MWNWENADWPQFKYDSKDIADLEPKFLRSSGELRGAIKHLGAAEQTDLKIELISEEAYKTSEIEGEMLNRASIQSSLRQQFGLDFKSVKSKQAEIGISQMMLDLYQHSHTRLTKKQLCTWHKMLLSDRVNLHKIGDYRKHPDVMQVVSGRIDKPTIHFEAPPADRLTLEMKRFVSWFNTSSPKGEKTLPPLTRASLAHLYFVSIHPFEDGNGRIARALSEKVLAQHLGEPTLIALAFTIEKHKTQYYDMLARSNRSLNVTAWIEYFSKTILEAQKNTLLRIEFLINKTHFFDKYGPELNNRQIRALSRMFAEGIDGFKGGLSAKNYTSITKTSTSTATRDLQELVAMGALFKTGQLKQTRYFLNMRPFLLARDKHLRPRRSKP